MFLLTLIFGILLATCSTLDVLVESVIVKEKVPDKQTADISEIFKLGKASLIEHEFAMTIGHNLSLNPLEELANNVIVKAKLKEVEEGFFDPAKFTPSFHFFQELANIRESPLYNLLKTMPKAGILHAHDTALGSQRILISLTYKEFCWICLHEDGSVEFLFSRNQPIPTKRCKDWQLMEDYRKNGGMTDEELTEKFSLYPRQNFTNVNDVWLQFGTLFGAVHGLLGYKDNFGEYIDRTFEELLEDGVQYVELRTSLREVGSSLRITLFSKRRECISRAFLE